MPCSRAAVNGPCMVKVIDCLTDATPVRHYSRGSPGSQGFSIMWFMIVTFSILAGVVLVVLLLGLRVPVRAGGTASAARFTGSGRGLLLAGTAAPHVCTAEPC